MTPDQFKARLAEMEARLTWRFAGAMFAQTGVILAAVIGAAVAILRMLGSLPRRTRADRHSTMGSASRSNEKLTDSSRTPWCPPLALQTGLVYLLTNPPAPQPRPTSPCLDGAMWYMRHG